ncbi:hypothetical protein PRIPAC_70863 [Pristionchus pacificus]|uniref:Uncharacterized protein n=1 Tax=Pristionchus pacificus TaxID=54126 RepID=A0A454XTP3_PRIPA|nr:hypothetical protein PRIPAC_70863 [Pristionchus pacificus]|eukprot:PDM71631.1 hypothetical protein PRIPAC_38038 [Pristionchus pacificus]
MTPMWGVSSDEYYANTQNPPRSMEIDEADETIESHLKRKRTKDTIALLEHLSVASPGNGASSQPLTPSDSSGAIPNEQPLNSSSSIVDMESGSPHLEFSPDCREAMLPSRPVHYDDDALLPSEADDIDMAQPESPRPTSTSPLIIPWPRLSAFRPLTRRSRRSTRPRSPTPEQLQPQQLSPAADPTTVQLLHHMLLKRGAARDGEEGPEEKRMRECLPPA